MYVQQLRTMNKVFSRINQEQQIASLKYRNEANKSAGQICGSKDYITHTLYTAHLLTSPLVFVLQTLSLHH